MPSNDEILSRIIKRVNPEQIISASGLDYRLYLQMVKDGIKITISDEGRKSFIAFSYAGLELNLRNIEINEQTVDFWLYRFKDLLVSYKISEGG